MSDLPSNDDLLAAEYVLRLLPPDAELAAQVRLRTDPAFAGKVAHWQEDFAALTHGLPDMIPRPQAKQILMQRLFPAAVRKSIWQRLGLWQGVAAAAVVLAVGVGTYRFVPQPTAPQPVYAVQLSSEAGDLQVLAVYDPANAALRLTRIAGQAAPGRVLELWGIADGNAPVSLGVLPDTANATLPWPDALASVSGTILAISDEPPGGSPTGQPTGDVLAAGPVVGL